MCLKEYFSWQVASLWFLIWRASITLVISAHMYFRSPGSGSGSLATFRPSRWHMLSYANIRFCLCSLLNFAKAATNHVITKRNTWAGPSDLFVIVCVLGGGGAWDKWLLIIVLCVYMCVTVCVFVCVCVCVCVCIKVKALPYLYSGCHIEMWPPPPTQNQTPLVHFCNFLSHPVSLLQDVGTTSSAVSTRLARSGKLDIIKLVPKRYIINMKNKYII